MSGFNISLRIWLSIGIFVLGSVNMATLSQVERRSTEHELNRIAGSMFPAAQQAGNAQEAFASLMKAYQDAFVLHDSAALNRVGDEAADAVDSLKIIAASKDVPSAQKAAARDLAIRIPRFMAEARRTYSSVAAGRSVRHQDAGHVQELTAGLETLKEELASLGETLSRDLEQRLGALEARSRRMRMLSLILFLTTLTTATVLVSVTIRRTIVKPLSKLRSELEEERDLLRVLLDHAPDYIYFKDAEGRYIRVNGAMAGLLGIEEPAEACGRTDADFFDAETAQQTRADEQEILASGDAMISKIEKISRPGLHCQVNSTKVPVRIGKPMIVGISRDMTEWNEMMEALRKSEVSFRLLFAAIPHAVWVYDAETLRFLAVNEAAFRQYGYPAKEFESLSIRDLLASGEPLRYQHTLERSDGSNLLQGASKHVTRDGRAIDVEIVAKRLFFKNRKAVLAVVQDVTDRKRLEVELQQAQRLEAVGQLAAGIAHEISTPIQYVGDNLRFLGEVFPDRQKVYEKYRELHEAVRKGEASPEMLEDLEQTLESADFAYISGEIPRAVTQCVDGIDRVASIVRAMKSLAHPGEKGKRAADLNKALSDTLIVARNELKYVAEVSTDFGELPPVVCLIADLNQVFVNLLVNAAHAIAEVVKNSGEKGQICVRTRSNGRLVIISVSDTGCGIPEAIRSRIFDPFFTTKDPGKGTGQGLTLARNIVVEKHGGTLTFEPNWPRGTTFTVSLPIEPSPLFDESEGAAECEAVVP